MKPCPFCNIVHKTVVPTIHLNGTSAPDLRDGLCAAIDAMHQAEFLMREAAPNGRDYYPQGQDAQQKAMAAHERRWADLNRILTELEEMRDHVEAVIDFEADRRASR